MVEITTSDTESYHLILVKGEVDASSSIELDNALKDAIGTAKQIMVDLSDLEYISSAGLGVFISYLEDVKAKNIKLVLVGLKPKVLEVFQILGLQNLMSITENREKGADILNEA